SPLPRRERGGEISARVTQGRRARENGGRANPGLFSVSPLGKISGRGRGRYRNVWLAGRLALPATPVCGGSFGRRRGRRRRQGQGGRGIVGDGLRARRREPLVAG